MNSPFLKSIAAVIFGGSVTIMELLRGASLVLVIMGGVMSVIGGYYAYRIKKLELEDREFDRSLKYKHNTPPRDGPWTK